MLIDLPTAARYNAWANPRLYAACAALSHEERIRDRRGFFRSIHGTLNHILLSDLIYRERLEEEPTTFTRLDEILYEDFEALAGRPRRTGRVVRRVLRRASTRPRSTGSSPSTRWRPASTSACRSGAVSPISSSTRSTTGARPTICCPTLALDPPPLDFVKFSSGE